MQVFSNREDLQTNYGRKNMGHYVYKYVLDNEIIYIGKNDTNLYSRLKAHGHAGDNLPREAWPEINNSKVFYFQTVNKYMSDVIESEMIRRHKPKWNKAKTSLWGSLPFPEIEWKPVPKESDITCEGKNFHGLPSRINNKSKGQLKAKYKTLYNKIATYEYLLNLLHEEQEKLSEKEGKMTFWGLYMPFINNLGFYDENKKFVKIINVCGCDIYRDNTTDVVKYVTVLHFIDSWKKYLPMMRSYANTLYGELNEVVCELEHFYPGWEEISIYRQSEFSFCDTYKDFCHTKKANYFKHKVYRIDNEILL